jgi:hypothetical protein
MGSHAVPGKLTVTVAVMVVPAARPVVSTVMEDVPWPLVMVPAETDQLKVGVTPMSPPVTSAVKVAGCPHVTLSEQEMLTVGHAGGGRLMQGHLRTVTVAVLVRVQTPPGSPQA